MKSPKAFDAFGLSLADNGHLLKLLVQGHVRLRAVLQRKLSVSECRLDCKGSGKREEGERQQEAVGSRTDEQPWGQNHLSCLHQILISCPLHTRPWSRH